MLVLVSGVWLVVVLGVDHQEGGGEMTLAWIAVWLIVMGNSVVWLTQR